jgi:hypothetical protein
MAAVVEQLQHAGGHAWLAPEQDIQTEAEEGHHACTPLQVLELQNQFAMTEVARWIDLQEQCLAYAFDAQALWLRNTETWALDTLGPWLDWSPRSSGGSAVPLLEPPTEATTAAWMHWSQAACTEFGKVWLDALQHDLETEPTAALAG